MNRLAALLLMVPASVTDALPAMPPRCDYHQEGGHAHSDYCRWWKREVTYWHEPGGWGISRSSAAEAFDRAARAWNRAGSGVHLRRAKSRGEADIVAEVGRIDGPDGILGLSHFPCPDTAVVEQRFDADEPWTQDYLAAVAAHEFGHALGLPHLGPGALMAPYYNPAVGTPQAEDCKSLAVRYRANDALPRTDP